MMLSMVIWWQPCWSQNVESNQGTGSCGYWVNQLTPWLIFQRPTILKYCLMKHISCKMCSSCLASKQILTACGCCDCNWKHDAIAATTNVHSTALHLAAALWSTKKYIYLFESIKNYIMGCWNELLAEKQENMAAAALAAAVYFFCIRQWLKVAAGNYWWNVHVADASDKAAAAITVWKCASYNLFW